MKCEPCRVNFSPYQCSTFQLSNQVTYYLKLVYLMKNKIGASCMLFYQSALFYHFLAGLFCLTGMSDALDGFLPEMK